MIMLNKKFFRDNSITVWELIQKKPVKYCLISVCLHVTFLLLFWTCNNFYFSNEIVINNLSVEIDLNSVNISNKKNNKIQRQSIKTFTSNKEIKNKDIKKPAQNISPESKLVTNKNNEKLTKVSNKDLNKEKLLKKPVENIKQTAPSTIQKDNTDIKTENSLVSQDSVTLENRVYIQSKIEQYRNFNISVCGIESNSIEIVILIKLNPDGSIREIMNLHDNADKFVNKSVRQSLINQDHRAIFLAAPFDKLNSESFEDFKQVVLKFTH